MPAVLANPNATWQGFAFAEFEQATIGFDGVNGLPKLTVADALERHASHQDICHHGV